MAELIVEAKLDNLAQVLQFVDSRILGLVLNKARVRGGYYRRAYYGGARRSIISQLRNLIHK